MDDEQAIWDAQRRMYAGFVNGRPDEVDQGMHPDVTIWVPAPSRLLFGAAGLDTVRAGRPSGPGVPGVVTLDIEEPVVTVWGDTAATRHVLRIGYDDGSTEMMRCTGVWRRSDDGSWLIAHSHEDVVSPT